MESTNINERSLDTLHEYAVPSNGRFKDHIGTVIFASADHPVKITTQTGIVTPSREDKKKTQYNVIQGYICVQDIVNGYISSKGIQQPSKHIRDWQRTKSGKQAMSRRVNSSGGSQPPLIIIQGSHEIQGTYFHPSLVLDVVLWVCPSYIEEIKEGYSQTIIQLNQDRQAQNPIQSEEHKDNVADLIDTLNRNYESEFNRETMAAHEIIQKHPSMNPSQYEEEKSAKPVLSDYQALLDEIQKITESRNLAISQKDFDAFAELQKILDGLQAKEKEYLLQGAGHKGQMYVLKWRVDNTPFYCGISEAKGMNGIESFQQRFKGHKQEGIKLFSQSDLVHIKMAGMLADYMIDNNITQYHTDLFDKICYTERLDVETNDRRTLEEIEGEMIRKFIDQGHKMFNTAKRAERIRSNSPSVRSVSRSVSNSRLESLQMTAKAAKQGEVDKKLQAIAEDEEEKKSIERIVPRNPVPSVQQSAPQPLNITNVKNQLEALLLASAVTSTPVIEETKSAAVRKSSAKPKDPVVMKPPTPQVPVPATAPQPSVVPSQTEATQAVKAKSKKLIPQTILPSGRYICAICGAETAKSYFREHYRQHHPQELN